MTNSEKLKEFDNICDKYQTWLIRIHLRTLERPLIIVWITDMSDNEEDKIILTDSDKIVAAFEEENLFEYLRTNQEGLPDLLNTLNWLREVEELDFISPTDFDLNVILDSAGSRKFSKKSIYAAIDFFNLFNDLAEQLNSNNLRKLFHAKELKKIWDFGYSEIFWKEFGSSEEFPAIKIPPLQIDFQALNKEINDMVEEFLNRIELLDNQSC